MVSGEDILALASREIGYHEVKGKKNKFGEWYGLNGVAWCMEFVQYVYHACGADLPFKTPSCGGLLNWYRRNQPECVSKEPVPGCIVIFDFPGTNYGTDHTGLFVRLDGNKITTIDGNTANLSDSNGGCVQQRTRQLSYANPIYIIPRELQEKEKTMKCVSGSNKEEDRLIKAIQKGVGAIQDGSIGTQTMSDIACKLGADCFPLALTIYSQPCIIARDAMPIAAHGTLDSNAISGSFNDGTDPCSILVSGGKVVQATSCHYWDDKSPETVLYRLENGTFGVRRVKTVDELPSCMSWAVGGMGLLAFYDPDAEGFRGKFADVLRKTDHTMLGIKNGYVYLCYCSNMTAAQMNAHAKKLGLTMAVMLDGGHVATINSTSTKINVKTKQLYVVKAH